MKAFGKSEGYSLEYIKQALEEIIWIQMLKDNPNLMLGISPLFREGVIHNIHFVPFMNYDLPTQDVEQLDLPIYPHGHFCIRYAPLHPTNDP